MILTVDEGMNRSTAANRLNVSSGTYRYEKFVIVSKISRRCLPFERREKTCAQREARQVRLSFSSPHILGGLVLIAAWLGFL